VVALVPLVTTIVVVIVGMVFFPIHGVAPDSAVPVVTASVAVADGNGNAAGLDSDTVDVDTDVRRVA
jgi:hypothetical protein